jgi:hypothetical protein
MSDNFRGVYQFFELMPVQVCVHVRMVGKQLIFLFPTICSTRQQMVMRIAISP